MDANNVAQPDHVDQPPVAQLPAGAQPNHVVQPPVAVVQPVVRPRQFTMDQYKKWTNKHTKHTNKLNKVNGIIATLESDHVVGNSTFDILDIVDLKNLNRDALLYAMDHYPDVNGTKFWNQDIMRELTNQTTHILNLLELRFKETLPR